MPLALFFDSVRSSTNGAGLPGVVVSIFKQDGSPATTYSDEIGTVAAQIVTDSSGNYRCYIANGTYDIELRKSGALLVPRIENVPIYNQAQSLADVYTTLAAATGAAAVGSSDGRTVEQRLTDVESLTGANLNTFMASMDCVGLYLGNTVVTSNQRKVVPNQMTVGAIPVSAGILPYHRRLFNRKDQIGMVFSGVTVTQGRPDPWGGNTAVRIQAADGNAIVGPGGTTTLPAGNHCAVLTIKGPSGKFTSGFQTFVSYASQTAVPANWTRVVVPFTVGGGGQTGSLYPIHGGLDGTGFDIELAAWDIFIGSSDLEPSGKQYGGHLVLGRAIGDTRVSLTGNVIGVSTDGGAGVISWADNQAPDMADSTIIALRRVVRDVPATGTVLSAIAEPQALAANYKQNSLDYIANGETTFTGGAFEYSNAASGSNALKSLNKGWQWVALANGANGQQTVMLNGQVIQDRNMTTVQEAPYRATPFSAPDPVIRGDWWFNAINGDASNSYNLLNTSGQEFAALAVFSKRLTPEQIRAVEKRLSNELAGTGFTPVINTPVHINHDGNSISGGWPQAAQTLINSGNSPVTNHAVQGAKMVDVINRMKKYLTKVPASRTGAQRFVYSLGPIAINDYGVGGTAMAGYVPKRPGSVLTSDAAWLDDLKYLCELAKAAGYDRVGVTLEPIAGVTGWEAWRTTMNTQIQGLVGTAWDFVIPLGTDAGFGNPANAPVGGSYPNSWMNDFIHPLTARQNYIRDIYVAAVNPIVSGLL